MTTKKTEFDCTAAGDRESVNAFLAQAVRGLRHKAFKLTSERNADGSFEIRIVGDGSAPGQAKAALPKPSRKRAIRTGTSEDLTTTTECCQPS